MSDLDWSAVRVDMPDPTPDDPRGEVCPFTLCDAEAHAGLMAGIPAEFLALSGIGTQFHCTRNPHEGDPYHVAGATGGLVVATWQALDVAAEPTNVEVKA